MGCIGHRVQGVTNHFSSFINAPNLLCTLLGSSEALYGRIEAASSNFTPDFTNCDVKGCFVAACGQKLISILPRAALRSCWSARDLLLRPVFRRGSMMYVSETSK